METRHCPRCQVDRSLADFDFRDTEHTKPQSYCRDCAKDAWRRWYQKDANRSRHIAAVAERRRRRQAELRDLIRTLKSNPCVDCGKAYPPEAMDFDHLREKTGNISQMVFSSGKERVIEEIAKCEIVCSNCHRLRTAARRRATEDRTQPYPPPDGM